MPPKRKSRRTKNSQKTATENESQEKDSEKAQNLPNNMNKKMSPIINTLYTDFVPETEEWRKGKTIKECHEYMLTNQIACDVFFELGDEKDRYGAHKYHLLTVSDVFYIMFLGPMAEQDVIQVPDIDLNTFKIFLKYVYTEKLDAAPDNVMQLMYVAKKYNIEPMVKTIVDFLDNKLTNDSVCTVMEQAHMFNEPLLETKALQYIEDNASEILQSEDVKELCSLCMGKVLASNDLHVKLGAHRELWDSERKSEAGKLEKCVLKGALTWAKYECEKQKIPVTGENQRKVLGEMIWLVRFSQLSPDYFVEVVAKMNILTAEERCSILENIVAPRKSELMPFSDKRRGPHENVRMVSRFRATECEKSMKNDYHHAVSFTPSGDFYLHGFCLFGTSKGKTCVYSISAALYREKTVISELSTSRTDQVDPVDVRERRKSLVFRSIEDQLHFHFRRKILIKKDTLHTLYVDMQGPPTYCGKEGRPQICFYTDGYLQITFQDPPEINGILSGTTKSKGQIPALLVSFIPNNKPMIFK